MPKYPKTKENASKESIIPSDHIYQRLKNVQKDQLVLDDLDKICSALDGATQLVAVKKVGLHLSLAQGTSDVTHLSIMMLVDIYFKCPTSLPLKRLIISCLNGANRSLQSEMQSIFLKKMQEMCDSCTTHQVSKLDVENLLMLLDTFPLFQMCVEPIIPEVLEFLVGAIRQSLQRSRETDNPVEKNDAMKICLKTVQAINKILQKFSQNLSNLEAGGEVTGQFRQMITCIKNILSSDYFLLDCQSTAGMTLPLLFNIVCGQASVDKICHSILGEDGPASIAAVFFEVPNYHTLSSSSKLCLLHGITTALSTTELTKELTGKPKSCLLITVIRMILLLDRSVDTNTKFMCSRCLIAWTAKACQCLDDQPNNPCLKSHLLGEGTIPQEILSYVWTHWEDPVEHIRHQARTVFENTIQMHLKATGEDPKESNFMNEMGASLLNISWTSKGKFGPLCSLIDHIGAEKFLHLSPTLPHQILDVVKDKSYASHASELYDKLATVSNRELGLKGKTTSEENLVKWQQMWVDPVLDVLCQGEKNQKNIVMEYMLPKLLKGSPASLKYITSKMSSESSGLSSKNLCALMSCLKKARSLGHIQQKNDSKEVDHTMWNDVVPLEVLQTALISQDDQIRLDALGLIVENPKISEVISQQDFELIKSFLPWNLSSQSPAFRQQLVSLLKRFFFRIRESSVVLMKNLCSTSKKLAESDLKKTETALQHYKDFLKWLCDLLFTSLYPGVCFPRCSTVVSIFATLLVVLEDEKAAGPAELFIFPDHVTRPRARSLIECLTNTFEEIRNDALKVLLHLPSEAIGFDNKDLVQEYYTVSKELICTTRPQDCSTAANLLELLIHQDQFFLLVNKDMEKIENTLEGRRLLCLHELLDIFRDQLATAKISLLHASATRPIYPVIHCIRYMLTRINLKSVIFIPEWRQYLEELIQACFDLTTVVSPVISHSSPEGNVPIESFLESDHESSEDIAESVKLVQQMPRYLIVCCWRCIKEISLLLGQLTLTAPIHHDQNERGMISCHLLCAIGDYFIDLLLESRHRGAFELAYAGFVSMCQMLWSCPIRTLHILPKQWLKQIMLDVKDSNSTSSRLCATRRSAGVPFYVQALVSTEPATAGRPCFKEGMKIMMELALGEEKEKENIPKVHALNILRTLFRDTRLSDDVSPFIADGLKAAVLGFLSQDWAIRNSSTLLFSALMTRIFGVPRGKDAQNRKNCLSGRVFFHRFPSVFPFLLEQLQVATTNIGADGRFQLHPALYPALMILGRLLPSVLEGKDTNLNLGDFIPYVVRCASSPVFKTRLMVARALKPLVFEEQLVTVITDLVKHLPTEGKKTSHNLIHGILLQINGLLQNVSQASHKLLERLSATLPSFVKTVWIATGQNKDYVTRAAYLTMLQHLLFLNWPDKTMEGLGNSSLKVMVDTVIGIVPQLSGRNGSQQLPCHADFLCALGEILIKLSQRTEFPEVSHKIDVQQLFYTLISNPSYEVRLLGLQEMKNMLNKEDGNKDLSNFQTGDSNERKTKGDISFSSNLMSSTVIFEKLVCMALKEEQHPECVTHLLEVLSLHPSSTTSAWKVDARVYISSEVLQWLMQLAVSHSMDEVRCATLTLSKMILPMVYRAIQSESSCSEMFGVISQWITALQEASLDHQSLKSRMTCAEVFLRCFREVLIDPSSVLGDIPFSGWSVLVKLLQDDDLTVRETAADVVINVLREATKAGSSYQSVQPEVALDVSIQLMVLLFCWRKWNDCFQTLISWTSGDWDTSTTVDEQNQEERLFDKGELNTYEDGIVFNRMSVTHMCTLLTGTSVDQNVAIGEKPSPNQDTHKCQLTGLPQKSAGMMPIVFEPSNQGSAWDTVAKVIASVLKGSNLKLPFYMFPAVSNDHMTVYDTYGGLSLLLDDKLSLLTTVQQHAQVMLDFTTYSQRVTDIYRILTTLVTLRGSLEKSGNIIADSTWDIYDQTLSKLKDTFYKHHSGLFDLQNFGIEN